MKFIALLFLLSLSTAFAIDDYKLGPLSQPKPDVPKGVITSMPPITESKIFPGMTRDWWIYVPAQYKADQPANLMVFQDGHDYVKVDGAWRVPVVFDNLIASGDMPVTIAIFINPGHNGSYEVKSAWKVSNRSFEYDSLGDAYARFLIDEVIPLVQKDYRITDNPDGWAIAGASSGAIAAFNVAWERPDKFHKVFSTIGTYVDIRGGHVFPYLVRKTERKPLRVFLQDGENDLDNPYGNWPIANRNMAASFAFMKYDYKFVMGDGAHNSKHGASIFPEAMQWLWRK